MNRSEEIKEIVSQGLLKQLKDAAQGDWQAWGPSALIALGLVGLLVLMLFLRTRIRYLIGSSHLHVLLLGFSVRNLPLDNIRRIHLRRRRFTERWDNTLFPRRNRLLVLEKRHGLFRHFAISPKKRQVFKVKLAQAMARHRGETPTFAAEPADPDDRPVPAEEALSEEGRDPQSDGKPAPAPLQD